MRVSLFWLGRTPLVPRKDYIFKLGTAKVPMQIEAIHRVIDASDLGETGEHASVERHQVAECTLKLHRAVAFDVAADLAATSRFVIVDDYDIRGGGIIAEALPDRGETLRSKVRPPQRQVDQQPRLAGTAGRAIQPAPNPPDRDRRGRDRS